MPKPRVSIRLRCAACDRNLADVSVPAGFDRAGVSPVGEVVARPGVPAPEVTRAEAEPMFGGEGAPTRYRFTCRCGATPTVRHDRVERLAADVLRDGIPPRPRSITL